MARRLTTTTKIIEQLGGTRAVAHLTHRTVQAVCNWRAEGLFPASTFNVMTTALAAKELSAPAELWRQVPVVSAVA